MNPVTKAYYRTYQGVFKIAVGFLPWRMPERIEGPGSVKKIAEVLVKQGLKKPLVVTDKGLMGLHIPNGMFESIKEKGLDFAVYDGVQPNPAIENIEAALVVYKENSCDCIIAFGGGSPMDCAKICAARVAKPNQSVEKMRGILKVRKKMPPFFAVPTTAGTGSETTIAAVITNLQNHEKYTIMDTSIMPHYAILDAELTLGLPPHITSTTGMDALTHAVEAYIGRSNTKDTSEKARMAVKLIFENLETVYADGKNVEARGNMLLASFYAGVAFTRAYVGYVHGIAHALGGLYNIPHGLGIAVVLPYVLDWFGESAHKRLAELADIVGIKGANDAEKAKNFIEAVREMNRNMGIPDQFEQIEETDIPTIVSRVLKESNPLYPVPRIMDADECAALVRSIKA